MKKIKNNDNKSIVRVKPKEVNSFPEKMRDVRNTSMTDKIESSGKDEGK